MSVPRSRPAVAFPATLRGRRSLAFFGLLVLGRGGDLVKVTIQGVADLSVQDNGDGSYRAVWTPFVTGTFEVHISLNGTAISGSPYSTGIRFIR